MYKIKEKPEDFIVREIPGYELSKDGKYSYYILKKKNYNTLSAIDKVKDLLHVRLKDIGFAGNKDRTAITEQYISILNGPKKDINFNDISLSYVGQRETENYTGNLLGNEFIITVRNLDEPKVNLKDKVINYFGEQRFSKNNSRIGRYIVKKQFKEAVDCMIESDQSMAGIKMHLEKHPNDFVGALKIVKKKTLTLLIHAFQSQIWNETAKKVVLQGVNADYIPIVGFGTEYDNAIVKSIIKDILKNEGITERDFIIKAIPELSAEGGERKLYAEVKDFKIIDKSSDELNENKFKVTVSFFLGKGSYATVVIKELFSII